MPKAVVNQFSSSQENQDPIQPTPSQSQGNASFGLKVERLEILHEIDQAIIAAQDIETTASSVLMRLSRLIPGYCASSILLIDDSAVQVLAIDLPSHLTQLGLGIKNFLEETVADLSGTSSSRPKAIQDLKKVGEKDKRLQDVTQAGMRAYLGVPLCYAEATLGSLNLLSNQPHAFQVEMVDSLQEIADALCFAIEHLRQHQLEQQRLQEAEAIRDVMAAVASAGNLSQILEIILVNLGSVVKYDRAGLFLLDENQRYVLADQPSQGQEGPVRTYLADDPLVTALQDSQRPVFVYDIQEDPNFVAWTDMQSVRGWLGAPLLVGQEMIGILSLGSLRPGAFGETEADIVQSFTRQVAQVLENAWLQEQSSRRTEELEVLSTITIALGQADSRESALSAIFDQITRYFGANQGVFFFPDKTESDLVIRFSQADDLLGLVHPNGDDLLWQVMKSGQVLIIQDVLAFLASDPPAIYHQFLQGMRSAVLIPISAHDSILGVLGVTFNRRRSFKSDDTNLYNAIAEISSAYLSRAVALEALEKQVKVRTQHLATLYDINAIASEPFSLKWIVDQVLRISLDSMNSHMGAIHLLDSTSHLRLVSYTNLPDQLLAHFDPLDLEYPLWRNLLSGSNPLMVQDVRKDTRLPADLQQVDFPGPYALLAAPIRAKGQPLGLLSIFGDSILGYSVEDITLFITIADQIGQSVERARLITQAEQAAVVEERQRLARELHDSVTQLLYSQVLFAGAGLKVIDKGNLELLKGHLQRIDQNALQALKEMRLLVFELGPSEVLEGGLVDALQRRLDSVEKRTGMNARLTVDGEFKLDASTELALYRIAQEALNNTLKHAGASEVHVNLQRVQNTVSLAIHDNGCGFDLREKSTGGGMGLTNMQERSAALGGVLEIISHPGAGTSIIATIKEAA
jgi:signal transduction histidine kinase/putative methionine-R-sulfoxide reductase with GAF domain